MESIAVKTELLMETCISCGIQFGVPSTYVGELKRNHKSFYCPNGHNMYYPGQTEEERLRKRVNTLNGQLGDANEARFKAEKQLNGALDRLSRAKKRANAGLCPHCNRHFANVERHVKTKHPEEVNQTKAR